MTLAGTVTSINWIMRRIFIVAAAVILFITMAGCAPVEETAPEKSQPESDLQETSPESPDTSEKDEDYPKIASWLAKKDEIISSGKSWDLVMSGWFTPEEAGKIREQNPDVKILAGLSVNWVWDNADWKKFLLTVASYGRETPFVITDEMYLRDSGGERCAFGWASDSWGHEEIYAMDPRSAEWAELITSFYGMVIEQPQHDGIIVDMVLEKSLCPGAISDEELVEATRKIIAGIDRVNTGNKLVIFNSGRELGEIDAYGEFMDGYLIENFMGDQLQLGFSEGLKALDDDYMVIYAVDTDDTGVKDMGKMRLGLVLSLLGDNAFFTYDFGPRDHGQAWWFEEYDVKLGQPLGEYYKKGETYFREFKRGMVVASPDSEVTVSFDEELRDSTTGEKSDSFRIAAGDGRIYLRE
ncbi:putative glycoside hydrolase [Chloroflexota bacterium]